jgi:ferredoxin/flavodoxin---NADP+ reductase
MPGWTTCRVTEKVQWAPGLLTLKLSPVSLSFEPGQFVNLGLDIDGERVKRAYSLASAPGAPPEFYVSAVSNGVFSPRLAQLDVGAPLELETTAQGFFSLRWLPQSARELWLIATGTGLGPFVSLWRSGTLLPRFERVVLVHGARDSAQLGYGDELAALSAAEPRFNYVPVLSREPGQHPFVRGRVTGALASGELEQRAGLAVNDAGSHFMLCGNPEMVKEVTELLVARGLRKHRNRAPGHITTEAYW